MRLTRLIALILLILSLAACASGDDDDANTEEPLPTEVAAAADDVTDPTDEPAQSSAPTLPPSFTPTDAPQQAAVNTAAIVSSPVPPTATALPAATEPPAPAATDVPPTSAPPPIPDTDLPLETIRLPPGFVINIYADNVGGARSLDVADDGTVFVGSRRPGRVYALRDLDGNNHAESITVLAADLWQPNGVAYRDGSLFVSQINGILRFDDVLGHLDAGTRPAPQVVTERFITDTHHGWKYLRFGPDGKLYVPQGVPCNVCEEDESYGYISRMNPDGSDFEIVAFGVRNSVGFDWHPETGDFWFTDNGRDWMGDDLPPDELNHVTEIGQHFGFPYCHGGVVEDDEFGFLGACDEYRAPTQQLGPHVAALGLRFYDGDMFPDEYVNQPFIAERGSWNRTVPIGYRITLVRLQGDQSVSYEPFAEGWLQGFDDVWGRPVDVLVMPDGAMLVSDDTANAVYRISYVGE